MSDVQRLRSAIELERLAAELGCDPTDLRTLEASDPDELAHLRHALSSGLLAQHADVFGRFAAASGLMPAALAASITRRIIGPALAGRIAASMPSARAGAITRALETGFLADTCRTLSPAAATALVPGVELGTIVEITAELVERGDHATLGRFVGAVDDTTLAAVLDVLVDPQDLLLAGAATDEAAALDRVVALLSVPRRVDILVAAESRPHEALSILVRLSEHSLSLLVEAVAAQPDAEAVSVLASVERLVREQPAVRVWARALPTAQLAAASRLLDRSEPMRSAVGRLGMIVLTTDPEPTT